MFSNIIFIRDHDLELWMSLTVREMDVFRHVVMLGSVTAAAEALNISQPAISRTLQQAEERLTFPLFVREKKRLIPTTEARILFAEVANVFAAVEQTRRLASELREREAGVLNIAAGAGIGHVIVPEAIRRFRLARPNVSIVLQVLSGPEVVSRVAQGMADVGLTVGPTGDPSVESSVICVTQIGCVLPAGHRLEGKSVLGVEDIADEPIICPGPHLSIGAAVVAAFADANRRVRYATEVTQATIACELVRAGVGIALTDGLGMACAQADDLIKRPLLPQLQSTARMLWPKARTPSQLAREFSSIVEDVCAHVGAA
ncbi:LysR family transcriptional regulator [Rhizobium sp. S152]|uniref:LysR family transcriptional regulator n=1 Tax=Rhizobium sp. S152 TaxID=3055038 RepID=UPI0025A9CBEA|nr:LysR family transcriptional regulator [Rhizobium sp. S152]MDM9628017.1 LysR family transcriptional regulator [Rhizobium sp. S152]